MADREALARGSARQPPTPFDELAPRLQDHLLKLVRGEAKVLHACGPCNGLARHGWLVYQGRSQWLVLDPAEMRGL